MHSLDGYIEILLLSVDVLIVKYSKLQRKKHFRLEVPGSGSIR
jgi:hypothetical protein